MLDVAIAKYSIVQDAKKCADGMASSAHRTPSTKTATISSNTQPHPTIFLISQRPSTF